MVRNLLVIEVPDASDKRVVTVCLRPVDSCFLSCESAENMVRMVFDHIIVNVRSLRAALRTSFYKNIGHSSFLSLPILSESSCAETNVFSKSVLIEGSMLCRSADAARRPAAQGKDLVRTLYDTAEAVP
jgi:hypothetical protein